MDLSVSMGIIANDNGETSEHHMNSCAVKAADRAKPEGINRVVFRGSM
jgi:hypothetical protein